MPVKTALLTALLTFLIKDTHSEILPLFPLPDIEKYSTQINESISLAIENIENYHNYIQNLSYVALEDHKAAIREKVLKFKSVLKQQRAGNSIVDKCLQEEGQLDLLAETINAEIQQCATIVLAEMVNVITDSLNEAQSFMTIPTILGADVQLCGLSKDCLWRITTDAFSEAVQVPPKVFTLAARIQSITLRTVTSIDTCGVRGFKVIADTGLQILEDLFNCIRDEIDISNNY